jgi:hypothetical protein
MPRIGLPHSPHRNNPDNKYFHALCPTGRGAGELARLDNTAFSASHSATEINGSHCPTTAAPSAGTGLRHLRHLK